MQTRVNYCVLLILLVLSTIVLLVSPVSISSNQLHILLENPHQKLVVQQISLSRTFWKQRCL